MKTVGISANIIAEHVTQYGITLNRLYNPDKNQIFYTGLDGQIYYLLQEIDGSWTQYHINPPNAPYRANSSTSIVHFNGSYYLFFTDATLPGGEQVCYFTSENALDWTSPKIQLYSGVNASSGPAAVVFKGRMYLFYKGMTAPNSGNSKIFSVSTGDGTNWDQLNKQLPDNVNTDASPVPFATSNRLFVLYKGWDGDYQLYWISSADGVNWDPMNTRTPLQSSCSPAAFLAPGATTVYLLLNKLHGNIVQTSAELSSGKFVWSEEEVDTAQQTDKQPAIALQDNGSLLLAWKGNGNEDISVGSISAAGK